jgi:hypothetical protein
MIFQGPCSRPAGKNHLKSAIDSFLSLSAHSRACRSSPPCRCAQCRRGRTSSCRWQHFHTGTFPSCHCCCWCILMRFRNEKFDLWARAIVTLPAKTFLRATGISCAHFLCATFDGFFVGAFHICVCVCVFYACAWQSPGERPALCHLPLSAAVAYYSTATACPTLLIFHQICIATIICIIISILILFVIIRSIGWLPRHFLAAFGGRPHWRGDHGARALRTPI